MADDDNIAAWDAREKYTNEIVYRIHLFLDTTMDDLKGKHETLSDLFLCVVCFIKNINDMRDKINTIESKIYLPTNTPQQKRKIYSCEAQKLIIDVYIEIIQDIKAAELLVPGKFNLDPKRGFAAYFPKDLK